MTPHELAHELEKIYGDELKSVVLYGSAANNGEHSKKFSDFNVFCVLLSPTPASLARANKLAQKWIKKGNPPIHFFGPEHIETSLDVFPIEFLDMIDRHRVLIGKDPLAGIKVDLKNLRHQCESELKGKLIHLRAFYAANCGNPKAIAKMMIDSFPTFLAAFRAVLRLMNIAPSLNSKEVIERCAEAVGFNPEIFFEVTDIRQGVSFLPRGDNALSAFERYLTELEVITNYIDRLETRDTRLET